MGDETFLAVARLKKPHGLKGEAYVWVLTDRPEEVLRRGRTLTPVDEAGRPVGAPVVVERGRSYRRHWLLKFVGLDDRSALERWGRPLLGVPAAELEPPAEGELYVHELPGWGVVSGGEVIGTAAGLVGAPGGELLAVDVGGREVLVPFRRPIVQRIDRAGRRIELDVPPGLLDL